MSALTQLNFPRFVFRMRLMENPPKIWDAVRRGWLVLTPEEWSSVRFLQKPPVFFFEKRRNDILHCGSFSDKILRSKLEGHALLKQCV